MTTEITPVSGIEAQHDLIRRLEDTQFGWDIVVGDAFVRGMRDIGYKSTAYALAELIDNSVQAGARHVDVIFGFDNGDKPTKLAVVDDGHGMVPAMVRASLVWGAGTRHDNREGFGKYGYGLPSASVSQARRVTVYSKTDTTDWTSSYLDVDEISEGKWSLGNRIEMPKEKAEQPPQWVVGELKKLGRNPLDRGTVVVWESLDQIDFKTRNPLRGKLITDLGVIYRNYLLNTPMTVDGMNVEPCDPLFLTEGFRYYDIDDDRAVAYPAAVLDVTDKTTGATGKLRVRYSRFPATFFRTPDMKWDNRANSKVRNERLDIADANNGIIFLRNGRQIDTVRPPRKYRGAAINATTDRFWAVEVDFDATIDHLFKITTSKQQITPSDAIWDLLDNKGLFTAIATMRGDYDKDSKTVRDTAEATKKRAAVEALEDAQKYKVAKPPQETPERKKEADDNLEREIERQARKTGIDRKIIEAELSAKQEESEYAVEIEDLPGAPFYRCEQRGGQRVLLINQSHGFYTDLYMGHGTNPRLRAALEVLLFTLGNAEVDADPESDRRTFYARERSSVWSPNLDDTLKSLGKIDLVVQPDIAEAEAETAA